MSHLVDVPPALTFISRVLDILPYSNLFDILPLSRSLISCIILASPNLSYGWSENPTQTQDCHALQQPTHPVNISKFRFFIIYYLCWDTSNMSNIL